MNFITRLVHVFQVVEVRQVHRVRPVHHTRRRVPRRHGKPLYKVLVNGRSCSGGDAKYHMPRGWKPSRWMRFNGHGFYLTRNPRRWMKAGCQVFLAQGRGLKHVGADKYLARSVRLVRRVSLRRFKR